jgi:uncharacterized membrane protein
MIDIVAFIHVLLLVVSTVAVLQKLFVPRFHPAICAFIFVLVVFVHLSLVNVFGSLNFNYGGLRVLLYFPLSLYLFKGPTFQKIFAFSLQLVFLIATITLIEEIAGYIFGEESMGFIIFRLSFMIPFYICYTILATKNSAIIHEKLFAYGSAKAWASYSMVEVLSFGMMALVRLTLDNGMLSIASIFFIMLSSAILCYAIVNTHEKTKQRIDAEFVRGMISSGRDHYQKMNDMYDTMRFLRHDFKFHLNAVRNMLQSGNTEEADQYLINVEKQIKGTEIPKYCGNAIINALLYSYAARCAELEIQFDTKLAIPENISVSNYDMCIIIGNLLENAVEANLKLKSRRAIEIATQNTDAQLLIMVKNNFDGIIHCENGVPRSLKTDGGFGLRSTREVIAHHGGNVITEWDNNTFTVYVAIKIALINIASIYIAEKKSE